MSRFGQNTVVKIISFILFIVLCFSLLVSGLGVYFLIESDVYIDGGDELRKQTFDKYISEKSFYVQEMLEYYAEGGDVAYLESKLAENKTNYRFSAVDAEGNELASSFNVNEELIYVSETEYEIFIPTDRNINVGYYAAYDYLNVTEYINEFEGENIQVVSFDFNETQEDGRVKFMLKLRYWEGEYRTVTIKSGVAKNFTVKDDFYYCIKLVDFGISVREWVFIYIAAALIFAVILFVILMRGAGHKKGEDGIYLCWFHKVPFDLYVAANAVLGGALFIELQANVYSDLKAIVSICIGFAVYTVMALLLCVTFAARVKKGGWYKNTIVYYLLVLFCKVVRILVYGLRRSINNLPLIYKTVIALVVITALELSFMYMGMEDFAPFWVVEKILLVPFIVYCVICMRKLQRGARRLAQGDTSEKIDTKMMVADFREHGENLNGMGQGIALALEKSMKSERLKTELITNVSHDIKTPLTSIINYVDLLKKEGVEGERAEEYIEVLDRQSKRLKRLTEDLVEASKASTGNLAVNFDDTDMAVLLIQATGEYETRLKEKFLEPVIECEEDLRVKADGRHIWRVFDNLMNNICKYSQPNTRVYITAKKKDGKAQIVFKNVSRDPLNISPDELTERFVRGDRSRYTEGSGLGLSIAKSLTELQGGEFEITIDGDLFKVSVTLSAVD